jgi:hypothetical protein
MPPGLPRRRAVLFGPVAASRDRILADHPAADDHPAAADETAALAHGADAEYAGRRIEPALLDQAAHDAGRTERLRNHEARADVLAHDDPATDAVATVPALLEALAPIRPVEAIATLDVAAAVGAVGAVAAARPVGAVRVATFFAELLAALPALRRVKVLAGAAWAEILCRGGAAECQQGADAERVFEKGVPEAGLA